MKKSYFFAMLTFTLPVVSLAQATPATNAPVTNPPVALGLATNAPASDAALRDQLPVIVDSSLVGARVGRESAAPTHARVDGALVRAARAGQPWQAINPFAPPEFGQWYENVSVNPHTQQPEGIVLVSVRFGGIGHAHR